MVKVIAVHGCRHGIGSSNLTANLAVVLARQQQRIGLIDTDPHVSALHLLFGISDTMLSTESECCFWGSLDRFNAGPSKTGSNETWLREAWIHATPWQDIPQKDAGICWLSRSQPLQVAAQQLGHRFNVGRFPRALRGVATELSLDYLLIDAQLIDAQPEFNQATLEDLLLIDILLILVGLENHDLQQSAVMVEVAKALNVPQILIIPSYVLSELSSTQLQTQLQTMLNVEVPAVLRFTQEMMSLASNGVFALHYPDHPLTQAVQTIANCLQTTPPPPQPTIKNDVLGALLATPETSTQQQCSLFELLELATAQRQIVTHLLRFGSATATDLSETLNLPLSIIEANLGDLVQANWLTCDRQNDYFQYQLQPQANPPNILTADKKQSSDD